jgi:hypothetical protein
MPEAGNASVYSLPLTDYTQYSVKDVEAGAQGLHGHVCLSLCTCQIWELAYFTP